MTTKGCDLKRLYLPDATSNVWNDLNAGSNGGTIKEDTDKSGEGRLKLERKKSQKLTSETNLEKENNITLCNLKL